jgi:hypothetical protein
VYTRIGVALLAILAFGNQLAKPQAKYFIWWLRTRRQVRQHSKTNGLSRSLPNPWHLFRP